MDKFQRTQSVITLSRKEFRKQCIEAGGTKKDADKAYREAKNQETYANDLYVVQIDRSANHGFGDKTEQLGGMFELTVRRQDREPIMDWRHMQTIKNEVVGPEHEMVQLFPKESRLRDAANQYWFYGFNNAAMLFPFGMLGRHVDDGHDGHKSKQRKL